VETFLVSYAMTTDETGVTVRRGKSYDRETATFYNEARAATAATLLLLEQKDKNEEEIHIVRNLSTRYHQLEADHPNDWSSIL
jgi:hypothetical protein